MITCLNGFLNKNRISRDLIPEAFILEFLNPYYNKLNITFGAYGKVFIRTINITIQRTVGAIALRPENKWCVYYFMSLATIKKLHAFIWTELLTNYKVIQRLNNLNNK